MHGKKASAGIMAIAFAVVGGCSAPNDVGRCSAPSDVGRYQLADNNRLIDTATGHVWRYEQQELRWRSLGNPATEPSG
jgi:hypothetical protein